MGFGIGVIVGLILAVAIQLGIPYLKKWLGL